MAIRNLTPHAIHFYAAEQFRGLEQKNPTTWVADSVDGAPLLEVPSEGVLRVSTSTEPKGTVNGIPVVATEYGAIAGTPDCVQPDDVLVVSLPALSMAKAAGHQLAPQMACPYQVVRSRVNGSIVLGAMGLSK